MPLKPLYPSGNENGVNPTGQNPTAGQVRTAQQTQSAAATPIDTWASDRQANPWTANRAAQSFGEIFQAALEQSAEPVADIIEPVTDIFGAAVNAVKETDAAKTQMEYLMATGQLDNPALLTIASTKAQLSVQLLVQLRNRALDAYNELMRISV
ncbi:MAG: flagellar hook-basal body complex protein FliE [Oscillospiraceae bacterium]|nr:flagellar hook-basal body complex protein FliE [Oscillospiraceae bacterium]